MNPFINEFRQSLVLGCKEIGCAMSDTQINLMTAHANELNVWNQKINLTSIKKPAEMAEKHFIDSIAITPFLDQNLKLLDLGSGGGFPGIPLKIMIPSLQLVLLDSSGKKVNFLKQVIRKLHLKEVEVVHARSEDLKNNSAYANFFDGVICRAVTRLENFIRLANPFLKPGGCLYAMKGPAINTEITPEVSVKFSIKKHVYRLPFEKSDRFLLRIKRP